MEPHSIGLGSRVAVAMQGGPGLATLNYAERLETLKVKNSYIFMNIKMMNLYKTLYLY